MRHRRALRTLRLPPVDLAERCPWPARPELGDVWTCPDCVTVWRYGWACSGCDRAGRKPGTAPASHHAVHLQGYRWRTAGWRLRLVEWRHRLERRRWHRRLHLS